MSHRGKKAPRRGSEVSEDPTPPVTPFNPDQTFKIPDVESKRGRPKKRVRNPYGVKGKPDRLRDSDAHSITSHDQSTDRRSASRDQRSTSVQVESAFTTVAMQPNGNCYFNALSYALYGNEEHAGEIRYRLFGDILQRIIDGELNLIIPHSDLNVREYLSHALLDDQTLAEYATHMMRDTIYAQVNDSILAAFALNRPIVVIYPRLDRGEHLQEHGLRFEDHHRQRVEAFFPDGDSFSVERDGLIQMMGTNNFLIHDDTREREIEHGIFVWHNGVNHFDALEQNVGRYRARSLSITSDQTLRRSLRIAEIRERSVDNTASVDSPTFHSHKDIERRAKHMYTDQHAQWNKTYRSKVKRRSDLPDKCDHPGKGCWARDSGHLPPEPLDIGQFGDKICEHCNALLLPGETSSLCCANGSIKIDDFQREIPDIIVNLLKHHAKHAYAYNTLLAMASATIDHDQHVSSTVCLLNGNVSHQLSDLAPGRGRPMFNELYCLNPTEAHAARCNMNVCGPNIDRQILFELDEFMRNNNVLAQQFKNSYEIWKKARDRAIRRNEPVPAYKMVILQKRADPGPRYHRIRFPLDMQSEVSAVYRMPQNEDLRPEFPKGLRVNIRDPDRPKNLNEVKYWDPNFASLLYPILHPYGQQGFRKGIPVVRLRQGARTKRNNQYAEEEVVQNLEEEEQDEVEEDARQSLDNDTESDEEPEVNQQRHKGFVPRPRKGPSKNVSMREYHRFNWQMRGPPTEIDKYFPLWSTRYLGQKFVIEMMWVIEQQEAYYAKCFQENLRMSTAKEFREALEKDLMHKHGAKLGRCFFTPTSYQGSKRHMQRAFNDALTITREVGTPTFFVTFTPSPSWAALKDTLKPGETNADRSDMMGRVFRMARRELWKDLEDRGVLGGPGTVVGHAECLEFQEKGMPHIHKLLNIDKNIVDVNSAEFVNRYIIAEILPWDEAVKLLGSEEKAKHLFDDLYPLLLHTCSARCESPGKQRCKYGYPHPFSQQTIIQYNKKPIYRRRSPDEGGATLNIRGKEWNNQWVVPHNLAMLMKYESHHNVEHVCGDEIYVLQYIFKYLFKGADMCYVNVTKMRPNQDAQGQVIYDYDEFNEVFTCRRMGPFEAIMRMLQEPFTRLSHPVKSYSVHKPNEQNVLFHGGEELEVAQQVVAGDKITPFIGYFQLCAVDKEAAKYTFLEFGKHYRWVKKQFQPYKRKAFGEKTLTRLYPVNPCDTERFAIRLLATHINGMSAFKTKNPTIDAYKTVFDADGNRIQLATFVDAAKFYNLLRSDTIWEETLQEASDFIPSIWKFTRFFAQLFLFANPSDPLALFEQFTKRMLPRNFDNFGSAQQEQQRQIMLRRLQKIFMESGRTCSDFGIPTPDDYDANADNAYDFPFVPPDPADADEELDEEAALSAADMINTLNQEQQDAFNRIMQALRNRRINPGGKYDPNNLIHQRLFWLTGEGGSGKTHLIKTIAKQCYEEGFEIALTAPTGRAAAVIPKARTLHSTFGLPIYDDTDAPQLGQRFEGERGRAIQRMDIIVMDEISMLNNCNFERVNQQCKDMSHPAAVQYMPFGGKVIVLCGDFHQLLTVVPGGKAADQVDATVRKHALWPTISEGRLYLPSNMRLVPGQESFRKWQKDIAYGRNFERIESEGADGTVGIIKVPSKMMVNTASDLINNVFDGEFTDAEDLASRIIFAPTNVVVDEINSKILAKLPGPLQTFYATDENDPDMVAGIGDMDDHQAIYQAETLHRITGGSLPHYKLELKIGAAVMLLKNIDPSRGLANGTRLLVDSIGQHLIIARIILESGKLSRNHHYIGRATFNHKQQGFRGVGGLKMVRTQFPLKLCFATTINKGQGVTVRGKTGLDVSAPVFQPGQLYTAVSRVIIKENLFIYNGFPTTPSEDGEIRNIIWKWEEDDE